jgi:hypothetical protein
MTHMTDNRTNSEHQGSRWLSVYVSLGALFLSALLVPTFTYPTGTPYVGLPGAVAGVATAIVCAWAFITCPHSPRLPKACTFVLLLPGLYVGFHCVSTYLTSGMYR